MTLDEILREIEGIADNAPDVGINGEAITARQCRDLVLGAYEAGGWDGAEKSRAWWKDRAENLEAERDEAVGIIEDVVGLVTGPYREVVDAFLSRIGSKP